MTSEKDRSTPFHHKQTLLILMFITIIGLSSCQLNVTQSRDSALTVKAYNQEAKEIKLARIKADTLHKNLARYFPLIEKPLLNKYINQVGKNIIQKMTADVFCCRFYLINMDSINAFSLPNGNIYITLQLLNLLDNEAELAAILSHEIAHIIANHSARKIHQQSISHTVQQALQRGHAPRISDISNTLRRVYEKGYKREIENEADILGLHYMVIAGYHPTAMISVFQKIKAHFKSKPKHQKHIQLVYIHNRGIFASYPSFNDRIKHARILIENSNVPNFPVGLILGQESFAPIKLEIHNILRNVKAKHQEK